MTNMFNRRLRALISGIAIGAMLFAQMVSVAQACTADASTPAMAFVDMDCEDMPSQNVCLHQYLEGDRNSTTTQVPVAALPAVAVLSVPSSSVTRPVAEGYDRECPPAASDPPASIRFCSFQI